MRTTAQVVATLGDMKGALMKVGQMVSYLDDGMPEPVRDALATLQQDAPPMSAELTARRRASRTRWTARARLRRVGPEPDRGRVDRTGAPARLHDGREVAVKVQYPGVDDAIRADLTTTDLLFRAISLMFPGLDPGPLVAELRARLVEELDYVREAENQRLFADYYAGHPFIRIPAVVDEFSTARVLTSEYVDGARFAEVEQWSQEERDLAAEAIFRFVFRQPLPPPRVQRRPAPGQLPLPR